MDSACDTEGDEAEQLDLWLHEDGARDDQEPLKEVQENEPVAEDLTL